MLTNKINFFKSNVLIQFFVSSTCFEHLMFIIRKTYIEHAALYFMFFMHLCKQSIRLKDVLDT